MAVVGERELSARWEQNPQKQTPNTILYAKKKWEHQKTVKNLCEAF